MPDPIVSYEQGYAVQLYKSGNYLGPDGKPAQQ